jgi:hypothetical protein
VKLALILIAASSAFADTWIAHRYDNQRVLFFFAELPMSQPVPAGDEIPPPQAQWGQAGKIVRLSEAQFRAMKLEQMATGGTPTRLDLRLHERLALRITGALTATVEIEEFVHETTCSDGFIGALARVVSGAEGYSATKLKYYVVGAWNDTPAAWKTTSIRKMDLDASAKSTLEARLNAQLKAELPKAESDTPRWRAIDKELAAGDGALTFDVQSVPVGRTGEFVYFVRAQWTIRKRPAFLMAVWTTASFEIQSVDAFGGRALRMPDFAPYNLGVGSLPMIVNVFDVDGSPAVLITSEGMESFGLDLIRYTSSGPKQTGVMWGYGC